MFNFDGEPTIVSKVAQALVENSGLNFESSDDDSHTCVVYRRDPLDGYLFVTALSGVRQHEPMFGPLVHDDVRRLNSSAPREPNPLAFATRENVRWYHRFGQDEDPWCIYLSGRNAERNSSQSIDTFKRSIYPALKVLLANQEYPSAPLFPEHWYQERLGRDVLREQFNEVTPGPKVEDVAQALTVSLRNASTPRLKEKNKNHIGIYLKTDRDWGLFGAPPLRNRRPASVGGLEETAPELLNAFAWVDRSTRPVLLRRQLSTEWKERLYRCGPDFENVYKQKNFKGICIVPLLDLHQQSRSMGVVMLVSTGPAPVTPAHLVLFSRLALDASAYLTPLLPIAGYPVWPRVSLWRGGARVSQTRRESGTPEPQIPAAVVKSFVEDLLPERSEVIVSPLQAGFSGTEVYRLSVTDDARIIEVPRVLKVGPAKTITEEFCAYHQYVHNKSVGGASRLDIGKVKIQDDEEWGALVYILVGSGEVARPWSEWGINASRSEIDVALALLHDQLQCWFLGGAGSQTSPMELLITKPFVRKKLRTHIGPKSGPPRLNAVKGLLGRLSNTQLCDTQPLELTCVVHGDLHSRNIFSLLGRGSRDSDVSAVALIDWGSVTSGRHPLSDISKLMADIVYKVRWKNGENFETEKNWAFQIVKSWGEKERCSGKVHWRLALIHQIAKMLFYSSDIRSRTPYLSGDARQQAWADLKDLASDLDVK